MQFKMQQLPGDRYTQEECEIIAKELGEEYPASNICRYCGQAIETMCFTMTGSCCDVHEKLRHNPDVFRGKNEFRDKFVLPPRVLPTTEELQAISGTPTDTDENGPLS